MLKGVNPCFNGRYSQSRVSEQAKERLTQVLILVLMEDTLREVIEVTSITPVVRS